MNANQAQPATMQLWNKGKFVGQKAPLKLKEIWSIRIRLQPEKRTRDLLSIRVSDVTQGTRVHPGPTVRLSK